MQNGKKQVGGQAVLGRQILDATPWLTERHGYDPTWGSAPKTPAETGKQLLDRIIEERNKKLLAEWEEVLKKNVGGKATSPSFASKTRTKKPVPIVASEIDEDEIPFEIPENWCWCRWGELSDSIQYGYNAPAKETGRIKMVRITDIQNGKVQWDSVPYCDISDDEITSYQLKKNDILFARTGGTVGKSFLVAEEPEDAVYAGYLIRTQYDSEKLNPKYMKMFMESQLYWDQLKNGTIATAQPNCNGQTLSKMILPLPPLSVQNAIVAKLEQVLPLVENYENAVLQKEELKSSLSDKVKKAILQEAITGKLTEEWRKQKAELEQKHAVVEPVETTESGEQLLARIIKERNAKALAEWEEKVKINPKAKKPVTIVASEIEEEEIPFEIPESWCWCRLGDLVSFGQCENAEPNEIEDGAWILDLEDIEKDSGRILQFKSKKEVDSKSTKHVFKKGYVLYSKLRPYLNKCVIAPKDGYCTSEILPLDFGNFVNNKFAQIFLMSPYFVDYTDSLSFGVKMPRLGTEDGKKALVPLPPLEEQEEIVKKVEELLPLCK